MTDAALSTLTNWFQQQAEREAKKEVLSRPDRWGNVIGIIAIMVVLVFFMVHTTSHTGFFTAGFGVGAAALFFGANAWGMISPAVKSVKGKKSPAKPFEIIGSILMLIALLYFLSSFTFDFSHLSDPLPDFLRWIVQWVSNDIARALMVLATIAMVFVIPFQIISYRYLRQELSKPANVPARIAVPIENEEAPKR